MYRPNSNRYTLRQALLSAGSLAEQNSTYRGSGGVSAVNHRHGFRPAFLDLVSGVTYLSCFANGCAAPVHVLDGLPDELVVERDPQGRITAVREGIIAGFMCDGAFYTREQAARALSH